MNSLLMNLRAGLRLLFFRGLAAGDYRVSADQLVLLAGLLTGLWFCVDWLRALPDPVLNVYAFADYGLLWSCVLFSAYLVSRLVRVPAAALALPVLILSAALPLSILLLAVDGLAASEFPEVLVWIAGGYWLWLAVAVARALYLVMGRSVVGAVGGFLFTVTVNILPLLVVGLGQFWEPAPEWAADQAAAPAVDAEAVFYDQPARMAHTLAALRPQRPGVSDAYFIGFAGDASQAVFAKEVGYVRALWDEKWDTRGRSLALVNDPATVGETPIASVTNLNTALRHIGRLMDPAEDVLVLFLTSHGSEDFELAVNLAPLALNPLTPEQLKAGLDESGIKWRIVIVSACYSGGYVAGLRDPYTAVMTAAAADRTSFGCDTERDFTYFGEAYFRDELARGVPLLQAFDNAAARIAQRERAEGLTPSLPQLFVGDEMAARLPLWETALYERRCGAQVGEC